MIPESDPPIRRDDRTPSVLNQAKANGWEADYFNFGKAEGTGLTYFNPGIVDRPDGLWLLARRSENVNGSPLGMNSVFAIKLDDTGKKPTHGKKLEWRGGQDGQQFEDARAFYVPHMKQTAVSVCTFKWHGANRWTGAIQMLGFFNDEWECRSAHYVPYSGNARQLEDIPRERYEKNWLFWMHGQRLALLYKSDPWTAALFGGRWDEHKTFVNAGAKWNHGQIRGGTPPVLVDGRMITFFHSSIEWRGNYRRYYMGAIAFSPDPPFEVLAVTPDPMLVGSQNDVWGQRKPPCIFPQGAVLRDGKWLITAGVNDLKAAWFEIPHTDVLKRLGIGPVDAPEDVPFSSVEEVQVETLSTAWKKVKPEYEAILRDKPKRKRGKRAKVRTPAQQAAIAKARATLAEKKRLAAELV